MNTVSVPCEVRTTTQEAIRQHLTANVRAVPEPVWVGFMVDKPRNGRSLRVVLPLSLQQISAFDPYSYPSK